ncbi:MAG: methyltransferase family protein [Cyclobacteriaceae bacterium]
MENTLPYLYLALLWIAYFGLHSLLAAQSVKSFLKDRLGLSSRAYRLFYVIFALLSLLPVLYYNALVSRNSWLPDDWKQLFTIIGLVLTTYGIIIMRLAFRQYSLKKFLGLEKGADDADEPFSSEGILSIVRHPLYSGTVLIVIGYCLFAPTYANLVTGLMIILYILVGIQLEEKKLIGQYGEQYEQYKEEVPMLIPRPGSLKRLNK